METIYKGIEPGTEIVDSQGHNVGKVHEVICNATDQLQMVTVQRGLIFKTDVAIPAVSIEKVEGGKIYLCVEKGALSEMLRPDPAKAPVGETVARAATPDADMLQLNAVEANPNEVQLRPGQMHDVATGHATHDMHMGSAAVPGVGAGNPAMITGDVETLNPTRSQEPTSPDRT
jgi:hypothetical protein